MNSLMLMAALAGGGNAPEQCYYYDPYPYYSYCWYGYPAWPCGPIIIVRVAEKGKDQKDKAAAKDDKADDKDKKDKDKKKDDDKDKKDLGLGDKALLLVELPADAKLFVDGTQMKSGHAKEAIITPALDPGRTYAYQVRVELVRGGQTLSETRQVLLRPGRRSHANFTELETRAEAIAAQR